MNRFILWGIVGILTGCLFNGPAAGAASPPEKGGTLPDIVLPVPAQANDRAYLGVPEKGQFRIPQIKAPLVIIEIFNMY